MTYDPYPQTTALPTAHPFPITEELPAVVAGARRGRSGNGGGAKWLAAFLVLLIACAVGLLVLLNGRSDGTGVSASVEPTIAASEAAPDDSTQGDANQSLASQDPGYFQVVGVPDGLNIRSGPGTNNDIIGALAAGQRHVFATGQRSTVNGGKWTQVVFGSGDGLGWVSSQFLSPDTAPDDSSSEASPDTASPGTGSPSEESQADASPGASPESGAGANTSVVCFESADPPGRIARITFTNRTEIGGQLRVLDGEVIDYAVDGVLTDGRGAVTLTNAATGEQADQAWAFNPASVDLGNGSVLAVVGCDTIALP